MSDPSNLLTIEAPVRDRPSYIVGSAVSAYRQTWGSFDLIDLELTATVTDTDGVDSVWATSDLGSLGVLYLTRDQSVWAAILPEDSLPGRKLETLVGHPIWIYCQDGMGHTSRSDPFIVVRVLYIPPVPESPGYQDTVSTRPTLTWYPYSIDFAYTFSIDVRYVRFPQNINSLVYHREGIPSDSLSHTLQSSLEPTLEDSATPGNASYYWTLSVLDEFGNRITSLESAFEVKSGD